MGGGSFFSPTSEGVAAGFYLAATALLVPVMTMAAWSAPRPDDTPAPDCERLTAPTGLAGYAAVVFLSTSGDVLDDAGKAAFEGYLRGGDNFVGVHAASTTRRPRGSTRPGYVPTSGTTSGPTREGTCGSWRRWTSRRTRAGRQHPVEAYDDPAFRSHLEGGIRYAVGG
jgi:hypothetical protein